jgi:hypothetical protein
MALAHDRDGIDAANSLFRMRVARRTQLLDGEVVLSATDLICDAGGMEASAGSTVRALPSGIAASSHAAFPCRPENRYERPHMGSAHATHARSGQPGSSPPLITASIAAFMRRSGRLFHLLLRIPLELTRFAPVGDQDSRDKKGLLTPASRVAQLFGSHHDV